MIIANFDVGARLRQRRLLRASVLLRIVAALLLVDLVVATTWVVDLLVVDAVVVFN